MVIILAVVIIIILKVAGVGALKNAPLPLPTFKARVLLSLTCALRFLTLTVFARCRRLPRRHPQQPRRRRLGACCWRWPPDSPWRRCWRSPRMRV